MNQISWAHPVRRLTYPEIMVGEALPHENAFKTVGDVAEEILSFLTAREHCRIAGTSRCFWHLINQEHHWRRVILQDRTLEAIHVRERLGITPYYWRLLVRRYYFDDERGSICCDDQRGCISYDPGHSVNLRDGAFLLRIGDDSMVIPIMTVPTKDRSVGRPKAKRMESKSPDQNRARQPAAARTGAEGSPVALKEKPHTRDQLGAVVILIGLAALGLLKSIHSRGIR